MYLGFCVGIVGQYMQFELIYDWIYPLSIDWCFSSFFLCVAHNILVW
jgi:hypothetical protein